MAKCYFGSSFSHNVVALIYYYEGNYIFTIDGTEYQYNFDKNGKLF